MVASCLRTVEAFFTAWGRTTISQPAAEATRAIGVTFTSAVGALRRKPIMFGCAASVRLRM